VRGEPIVCTPEDAYRCFMATAMDYLVLGRHVLDRRLQPGVHELTEGVVREFEAD
jgi:carbamoyltransferase